MCLDGLGESQHFRTGSATLIAGEKDQPDRFVEPFCGCFDDFLRSFRYHDEHLNKEIGRIYILYQKMTVSKVNNSFNIILVMTDSNSSVWIDRDIHGPINRQELDAYRPIEEQ